jgi:hypothetical protein
MISFFKKETKELKERKKLEKKLQKDAKVPLTSTSTNQLNVNLSNLMIDKVGNNELDHTKNASISSLIHKFEKAQQPSNHNQACAIPTTPPRSKTGVIRGMSKFYGLPDELRQHQQPSTDNKTPNDLSTAPKHGNSLLSDINGEFKLPNIIPMNEYLVRELIVNDYDSLCLNRTAEGLILCNGLDCLLPGLFPNNI